jgi:clan AA aspartic protease
LQEFLTENRNFDETGKMGNVYAEIEIINGEDLTLARKNVIGEDDIRRMFINTLVDTGAINLCINEDIQEILGFPIVEQRKFRTATGQVEELPVVGNVEVRFQNRSTECRAIVLPGSEQPLLGAIVLEDLDVIIDARRQEMFVNPESPDMALMMLKYHRRVD